MAQEAVLRVLRSFSRAASLLSVVPEWVMLKLHSSTGKLGCAGAVDFFVDDVSSSQTKKHSLPQWVKSVKYTLVSLSVTAEASSQINETKPERPVDKAAAIHASHICFEVDNAIRETCKHE